MVKEGLLKKTPDPKVKPAFYHLASYPKAYNKHNCEHEKIGADIYVNLQQFIIYWDHKEQPDFTSVKVKPDRQSVMGTQAIMWEIDRATMIRDLIIEKARKYINYANKYERQFYVIFACPKGRVRTLLEVLKDFRHGLVWFFLVDYEELLINPTGQIFTSLRGERVTLLYLAVRHETLQPE